MTHCDASFSIMPLARACGDKPEDASLSVNASPFVFTGPTGIPPRPRQKQTCAKLKYSVG